MAATQVVSWKIVTREGATIQFTTVGYEDTAAATEKWIGKGHTVSANWEYV